MKRRSRSRWQMYRSKAAPVPMAGGSDGENFYDKVSPPKVDVSNDSGARDPT